LENVPCLTYSCQLLSAPGLDFVRSWAHQSDPLCTVRFPLLYSRSASQTWARRKTETCPEKFLCTTLAKFFCSITARLQHAASRDSTDSPLANCLGYWHHLVCHRHGNVVLAFGLRLNVRFGGIADMPKYAINVAIGGKADMGWCTANVCC
jgi:hypothetical protein